jgi:hypothetical protein
MRCMNNTTLSSTGLLLSLTAALASACASDAPVAADGEAAQVAAAPTYAELYDTYFAPGTPGHCATAGCHADPGHNVWLCGSSAELCYQGMVGVGLIDPDDPTHSDIADPKRSPLAWFNAAGGNMPLDAQGQNDTARDAIQAWVAAGAKAD